MCALTELVFNDLVAQAEDALRLAEGDSNDAEIDAWRALAERALGLLGVEDWMLVGPDGA